MATKRTRVTRSLSHRINATAVEAYRASDFAALHCALNLKPWKRSPLPIAECELGVDQGEPPAYDPPGPWRDSWFVARELQAELEAASNA